MEEISPIEKIAALILNQAAEMKSQAVLLDKNGNAKSIILKFKLAGHWRMDFDRPPKYLWSNLRNVYLLWAGADYWKKGAFSGIIRQHFIIQEWSLNVSESHDVLEFKPIAKNIDGTGESTVRS